MGTDYCRVRAYPFNEEVRAFIRRHRVYVVEQNRDAQLGGLLRLDLAGEEIGRLRHVLHYNGLPIDARSVTDEILSQEGYDVVRRATPTPGSMGTWAREKSLTLVTWELEAASLYDLKDRHVPVLIDLMTGRIPCTS